MLGVLLSPLTVNRIFTGLALTGHSRHVRFALVSKAMGRMWAVLWAVAFLATAAGAQATGAKTAPAAAPAASSARGTAPVNALQFLGSYSAPAVIRESETGHTSARPPGPAEAARLRELTGASAGTLDQIMQPPGPRTPGAWFQAGALALAAARAASRQLAMQAPRSAWNRRVTEQAVQWARSAAAASPAGGRTGPPLAAWRALRRASVGPATPADLYQRVQAAEALSAAAFARAAAAPQYAARIAGIRALAASQADQFATARRDYRAGLALDPANAALHAGLGELERRQRRYTAAEPELAAAWRLNPRDPLTAFEYGDVEYRLNHLSRAQRLLNRALALDPHLLLARWTRAQVEERRGETKAALRDYLAAQSADRRGRLQYQLGRLYLQMGRRQLAAAAFRRSRLQRQAAPRR